MRMKKTMSGTGWLAAASLAATFAAYGCTSNQYAGNGQPTMVTPTVNSSNHSTTYGSSSGTVPMSSSYMNPATSRVDVDALANLAAQQGFRGRVLGPSDPGGTAGIAIATGGFQSPADIVYPQQTVNSSINSQPTPVITGGDASNGITIANASVAGGATVTGVGTTAAATTGTTATTGALTSSVGGTTVAGTQAFQSALMNSTPAPQATGTVNPTLKTVVATGRPATATRAAVSTSASRTSAATSAARTTTTGNGSVAATAPIQLQTGSNGSITMTNTATKATVKGK